MVFKKRKKSKGKEVKMTGNTNDTLIVKVKENRPNIVDVSDTKIMKKYKRTLKEKYSAMDKDVRLEERVKLVPTKSGFDAYRRVLLVIDVDTEDVLKEVLIG